MENKQWLFYILVLMTALGIGYFIWRISKGKDRYKAAMVKSQETNTFHLTSRRLKELNRELLAMLQEKTMTDVSSGYYKFLGDDESGTVDKVRKAMHGKFKLSQFNMDGASMDEPILKMNATNPKLFELLGSTGFLTVIGKIISTATWCSSTKTPSASNLNAFWQCIDKVDWKNQQVWSALSAIVGQCIR